MDSNLARMIHKCCRALACSFARHEYVGRCPYAWLRPSCQSIRGEQRPVAIITAIYESSGLVAGSITGLVMAGGRSRRMGEDKAGLQLKDKTFLQAALDDVHRVCKHVVVALNAQQSFDLPDWCQRLDDKHDYAGPVQALLDAAERVAGDFLLVRAVDMPYADSAMLTQQPMPEYVDARMVEVAGRIQPLIGLYRRQALLQLAACRPRRMMDVVAAIPVERIKMDGADWVNVNQQQDYDVLRSRA